MKILTIDLVALSDAAKALKQKNFIVYKGYLFGTDNAGYITCCNKSDNSLLFNYDGLIFNTRDLSAFIKTIATETEFDIDFDYNNECILKSFMDGIMTIKYDNRLLNMIINKYNSLINYKDNELDITVDLIGLFDMKKTDGCFYYKPNINNKQYFMTLFPGLLPLNKADKVFLSIKDFGSHFISFFTVEKKKYKVQVIVCYLKV